MYLTESMTESIHRIAEELAHAAGHDQEKMRNIVLEMLNHQPNKARNNLLLISSPQPPRRGCPQNHI